MLEFKNFFESLPEEKKELFNNENYIQLEELQEIRGGSAHLDDPDTISVNDIKNFLINEEENPGILLRAFGFFPEFHGR